MEQYRKITKQLAIIYCVQIFEFILMFALFSILTRLLTKDEFGIYSIMSITLFFLTAFLTMGFQIFVVRDLSGEIEDVKKEKFSQLFTFVFFVVILSVIILIFLGVILLQFLNHISLQFPLIIIIVCSGVIVLGTMISCYPSANNKPEVTTILNFLFTSLWALPLILLTAFFSVNINNIFLTKLLITAIILFFVVFYFKRKKLKFFNSLNMEYIKKAAVFGLPLSLFTASQWFIVASDKYVLGIFYSAESVGLYSYVYSILNYISMFSAFSISMVIYPYVSESHNLGNTKKSNFLLNVSLKYILLLVIPSLVGFLVLSKEIVTMISGLNYLSSLSIVPFLMVFPLFEGINIVLRRSLSLKNKTTIIAKIYLIGIIVNLILNLVLIRFYGYYGAALATSITFLILTVMLIKANSGHFSFNFKYLKLERILLSTFIMTLSIAFIHPQNVFMKLATIFLGGVVYIISLYLTKAYVKEELELLKSFLPKINRLY